MANLTVHAQVAGSAPAGALAAGTSLTAKVWPASTFPTFPSRGAGVPNTAATASGTTDGSGNVTLAGLSAVDQVLLVVDARGVNNWFAVSALYVGGSTYNATIPWSTPVTTTKPLDARGGDTVGLPPPPGMPYAPTGHTHEIPTVQALPQKMIQAFPWTNPPARNTWYQNTNAFPIVVYCSFQNTDPNNPQVEAEIEIQFSDEASHADAAVCLIFTIPSGPIGAVATDYGTAACTFLLAAGSYWQWSLGYAPGAGAVTAMNPAVSY